MKATTHIESFELARQKLIVALDFSTSAQARRMVETLKGKVGLFKIGSQLFCSAGPELVREIVDQGEKVFLDLKFHDIPNTVAAAAVAATSLGVTMLNVHAAAGREAMLRTREQVSEFALNENIKPPKLLAVTVLTSSTDEVLNEIGVESPAGDQVKRLATLAASTGMDGVVASPQEVSLIRGAIENPHFLIVTPGVRPASAELNDQKRVSAPSEAIKAGSDYLVVGRPITSAKDPEQAAVDIIKDMAMGLK